MRYTALILVLLALLPTGCRQRQHIAKRNIEVVQRALAEARSANAQVVHLTRTASKAAPTAAPRLASARPGGPDAIVTAKEVESVLGPPHEVDPPETALRDVEVFRYYYYQDADRYEFHFHNGQLLEIKLMQAAGPDKKS